MAKKLSAKIVYKSLQKKIQKKIVQKNLKNSNSYRTYIRQFIFNHIT